MGDGEGSLPLGVHVRYVRCGGDRVVCVWGLKGVIRTCIVCVEGWLREVTSLDVQILYGSGDGVVVCVCQLMGVVMVCIVCV